MSGRLRPVLVILLEYLVKRIVSRAGACAGLVLLMPVSAWPQSPDAAADAAVETIIVTAVPDPLDPVVVAQARGRLARTPGAVAVVASETYETRVVQGVSDLLRDVPGVLAQKRYGEESRLSIRGSGLDQSYHQRGVLLAQDGVPFADADGFSDFQKIDPLGARYIEVYKGGNALRFGGAQLGGAVNLVTPTGHDAQSADLLRMEAGSFGTGRLQAAAARDLGDWDFFAAADGLRADGYREQSRQQQLRGTLNLGRRFGDGQEVRAYVQAADIHQLVPGTLTLAAALATPESAGAGAVANHWARDQTVGRGSLQTHWRFSDALSFDGGVYLTHTDLHHPIVIVIDQQASNQGLFGRFDWQGLLAGHAADLYWGLSYRQGGTDQQLYANAGGRNGFQFGNARQDAQGADLFAEGRWFATGTLALVAGGSYGRADRDYTNHQNAANDASRRYSWFAPRFGLLWQGAAGTQAYANLTRSVEPPHFGALVQAPYPGFVPVDAQRAWTAELGTRGRTSALTWDIALYRSRLDGELLSFDNVYGLPSAFANAGRSLHQGLEAALDWRLAGTAGGRSLLLRQGYTYSDFRFVGDARYGDNRLPVVPRHQYRAELRFETGQGFFIAPALEWRIADTYVDYANTLQAPAYALWSLDTGRRWRNGVELFLDLRNLANRRYTAEFGAITNAAAGGASTAVFYPGEGRAVYAGVAWRY